MLEGVASYDEFLPRDDIHVYGRWVRVNWECIEPDFLINLTFASSDESAAARYAGGLVLPRSSRRCRVQVLMWLGLFWISFLFQFMLQFSLPLLAFKPSGFILLFEFLLPLLLGLPFFFLQLL